MKGKVESVMRINDSYNQHVATSPAKSVEPKAQPSASFQTTEESSRRDATDLTDLTARVMQSLETASPDRASRVSHLKHLYSTGAYETDSAAITKAMITNGLGLGTDK